jgi:hypothetical protein
MRNWCLPASWRILTSSANDDANKKDWACLTDIRPFYEVRAIVENRVQLYLNERD